MLLVALDRLPDADAVLALQRAADGLVEGGKLSLLFEELDLTDADEHEFEEDLIQFALRGGSSRTPEENRALFESAALTIEARDTVGWGVTAYTLTR